MLLLQLWAFWQVLWPLEDPGVREYHRIVYKAAPGTPPALHLYLPADGPGPYPCVIFVHGGLWRWGTAYDFVDFNRNLAHDGIASATIDFRKHPPNGLDGQIADIQDAIRWLRRHAADWNLDESRFTLFGSSSGSHLAALAAYASPGEGLLDAVDPTPAHVAGAFLLYGQYDLRREANPLPIEPVFRILNLHDGSRPDFAARYSPITYVDGTEPATLIVHGVHDPMVPFAQATAMAAALRQAGVPAAVLAVQDAGHGFARYRPRTRPGLYIWLRQFATTPWLAPAP